ncbi:hypothetical protein GmHk_03G006795 [Glycine max]|nr:hypothetical protein GmHk_03G006795 [Glycine max]KAH1256689.1 hypothetical protein GmHk_03G006795 [Glycine max]KAH1256690.1 hypothetical protein GmHk_03G006795 [Glycine max]
MAGRLPDLTSSCSSFSILTSLISSSITPTGNSSQTVLSNLSTSMGMSSAIGLSFASDLASDSTAILSLSDRSLEEFNASDVTTWLVSSLSEPFGSATDSAPSFDGGSTVREISQKLEHGLGRYKLCGCNKWSDFQQSGALVAAIFIDDGCQLLQTKLQKYGFITLADCRFNLELNHLSLTILMHARVELMQDVSDASASPSTLKWTRKATRLRSLATRPPGVERPVVNIDPATGKADSPHKKKLRTYLGIVTRDKVDAEFEIPETSNSRTKKKILQTVDER